MRQKTSSLLLSLLFFLGFPLPAAAASPPAVTAEAGLLMDLDSGHILWQTHAEDPFYPASITKILTALTVLAKTTPEKILEVPPAAVQTPGTSAGLRPGEKRSVEELLGSLLLVSGNDAASALALGLAGSEETFAQWMNQEARKLGATHSRFSNPHGLPDPHHITTARDMALIARAFWQNPLLRRIAATPKIQVGDHLWVNENKLLGQGGVDGMKTGYTQAAGHTYVASATYRGRHLLVVLLKDTKDGKYQDAQNLFRWGWTHYRDELLLPSGAQAAQVQVRGGLRPFVPLTPASSAGIRTFLAPFDRVTFRVEGVPSWIEAPIEKGETLGTLEVWVNGRLLASYPLVAAGTVLPKPRENARPPLQDAWRRWWSSLVSLFLPSPVLPKGPASSGFSEEMAGNDHLLDLAGAFIDLRRLGIP